MALTYKDVAEILKMVDASDCQEFVVDVEGTRLVVRKGGGAAAQTPLSNIGASAMAPGGEVEELATTRAAPRSQKLDAEEGCYVRAPMVGTFYRRPSPQDPPFVDMGSKVAPGDAICLIEVMKLYTTIEAAVAGEVTAVLVDDATLVEFDQPLFVIREI